MTGRERGKGLGPPLPEPYKDRKAMDSNVRPIEAKDSITAAAREVVRAYYLGEEESLSQAMETLNSALAEVDGIDYRRFAASRLVRVFSMLRTVRSSKCRSSSFREERQALALSARLPTVAPAVH